MFDKSLRSSGRIRGSSSTFVSAAINTIFMWVSYRKRNATEKRNYSLRTFLFVTLGMLLALAAASGAFGAAMRPVGIVLSVPLLFAGLSIVIGGPWITLMWVGEFFSQWIKTQEKRVARMTTDYATHSGIRTDQINLCAWRRRK